MFITPKMQYEYSISAKTDSKAAPDPDGDDSEEVSFFDTMKKKQEELKNEPAPTAPYASRATNGVIPYGKAVFFCDYEHNRLTLGDISDRSQCLHINLSGSGSLLVNFANINDLLSAITMFSPEDRGRIPAAIQKYRVMQQIQENIKDTEDDVAESLAGAAS